MSRLVDVRNVGQEKLLFIVHVTFFLLVRGSERRAGRVDLPPDDEAAV